MPLFSLHRPVPLSRARADTFNARSKRAKRTWFLRPPSAPSSPQTRRTQPPGRSLVLTGGRGVKSRLEALLPRGTGQAGSAEFNLLYRWHSTVSERDAQWVEDIVKPHCKGKSFDDMTAEDFMPIVRGILGDVDKRGPRYWSFGGFKRTGQDGSGPFRDEDIVRTLTEATDAISGAFKARGVPSVMKVFDVMGMAVARNTWNVASLNEFRKFLNLTEYKTFEEWAGKGNEDVAATARRLYKHIDNLELMPGLACEEPKPSMEGSGLCPGYTISRAILSDAAALVRGDRYLTTDYTAGNLTSAMFRDLEPELENGAFGGYISKLLLRLFPSHYTFNSTYALFPFTTPNTTNEILRTLRIQERYDASRPTAPKKWTTVHSYRAAESVLRDEGAYESVYGAHIRALVDKYSEPAFLSTFTAFSDPHKRDRSLDLVDAALFGSQWAARLVATVGEKTKQQIAEMAWSYDKQTREPMLRLDLVSDLVVPVAMNYVSQLFGLPMKTRENPRGLFTPQKLYEALADCYTFVYQNFDPTVGYQLRETAKRDADVLRSCLALRLGQVRGAPPALHTLATGVYEALTGKEPSGVIMPDLARKTYDRALKQSDRPVDEVAGILLVVMVEMVTAVSVTVNVVDRLLRPENKDALGQLCKATQQSVGMLNESEIMRYVEECARIQPAIASVVRRARVGTVLDDGDRKASVEPESLVLLDMRSVNRDPGMFPKPEQISLQRSPEVYKLNDTVQRLTNRSSSFSSPSSRRSLPTDFTLNLPSDSSLPLPVRPLPVRPPEAGESFATTFAAAMLRDLCQPQPRSCPGRGGAARQDRRRARAERLLLRQPGCLPFPFFFFDSSPLCPC
ncbi:hypothetical protein JCM6882_000094 [Rhodosporidiobolus microsporus]